MKVNCPECEGEITLNNVMRGEIIQCPDCGAELEVLGTDPVVLELAPADAEDYGE